MRWSHPPVIKIYEALGAVADGRVEVSGNSAKVWSSSRNKAYDVSYDSDQNAIMTNDNGSFWKGYLGYPAIAYLMQTDVLDYADEMGNLVKDIPWKDINQKFKNDFDKTLEHILSPLSQEQKAELAKYVQSINTKIAELDLDMLSKKQKPPEGY